MKYNREMLIPFGQLVRKYGLQIRGILHVGAHMCEELAAYNAEGVKDIVWLEANESLVKIQRNLGRDVHHILASDKDSQEVQFHISNNGQSSSMLELGVHKTYHPDVHYTNSIKMTTKRIDTLAKEQKWDMGRFNMVNLDVQGADLLALKGMDSLLHHFDSVYVEVNTDDVYVGCAKLPEMDQFLASHGFERKELAMTHAKWGDAFYLRVQPPIPANNKTLAGQKILLDVGAHRGMYSDTHMGSFDRLLLVEANPKLVEFLRTKYKDNSKVTIIDRLLTDKVGKSVTFYACNVDTVSSASPAWVHESRFCNSGFEWNPRTDLVTTTIDAIIKEYGKPTRTKIDVEGYESHVLRGLSTYVGPMSFEWAEEVRDDIVECIYHLLKLGYTKFHIQNQDQYHYVPAHPWLSPDQTIQALNLWNPKLKNAWGMIHAL